MITQKLIYKCDRCPAFVEIISSVSAYDDPVIPLPGNWDYHGDELLCSKCDLLAKQKAAGGVN